MNCPRWQLQEHKMKFKESSATKWDNGHLHGFVIFITHRCNMDKTFDSGLPKVVVTNSNKSVTFELFVAFGWMKLVNIYKVRPRPFTAVVLLSVSTETLHPTAMFETVD